MTSVETDLSYTYLLEYTHDRMSHTKTCAAKLTIPITVVMGTPGLTRANVRPYNLQTLMQHSPTFLSIDEPLKSFSISQGMPTYENENKTMRQFIAHRHYSSIANCRTKNPAIFEGGLGIYFAVFKNYSTIFRETPTDVPWNPNWETPRGCVNAVV